METNNSITNESNELIANLITPKLWLGKWGDWKNGYGKYTVTAILVCLVYDICYNVLPAFLNKIWNFFLFVLLRDLWLLRIAYYIYKGTAYSAKNPLIINGKGIFYNNETINWDDILSYQISLEKKIPKGHLVYYLRLKTRSNINHQINIGLYDKKFNEIQDALIRNTGKHAVQDLGFKQLI